MTASPLGPERWDVLKQLFDDLADLHPEEQARRLKLLASTDPDLSERLHKLLAADRSADATLQSIDRLTAHTFQSETGTSTDDPFSLKGLTISHFKVLNVLGSGGMGVAYRAVDERLGRTVALKFVLPAYSLDASAKERFLSEARAVSALDHPNVCTVYEVGESEEGQLFLALACYDGETLKARLARAGRLPVAEALEIVRQVALGLGAAHAAGIVHRDVKPGNLMLLPDGTVKILDFGVAKARDLNVADAELRAGTVGYMSPEQLQGNEADQRSDLWSLGVILYEMLTGQTPFGNGQSLSTFYSIAHEEPATPSTFRVDLPATLDQIVSTLLRKDMNERYTSAAELLADVQRASGPAKEPSPSRRMWPALFVVAAVLLGGAGVAFSASGLFDDHPVVIAVGSIRSLQQPDSLALALPMILSSQLARVSGLEIVSRSRMFELSTAADGELTVARRARAQFLLDGELHTVPEGFQLQLRRVDVRSGQVRQRYTVVSKDGYDLANRITTEIAASLELSTAPSAPPNAGSIAAAALLEESLRTSIIRNDARAALTLAAAALERDSTFAMAALHAGFMASLIPDQQTLAEGFIESAERLAHYAAERDQLYIRANSAQFFNDPSAIRFAELLSQRYPLDPAGPMTAGGILTWAGEYRDAIRQLRQAIELDRPNLAAGGCATCVAYQNLIAAYQSIDSFPAALRVVREWAALQPGNANPLAYEANLLDRLERFSEANDIRRRIAALNPGQAQDLAGDARRSILAGDFTTAERLIRVLAASANLEVARDAAWLEGISLRVQGRYREAFRVATHHRALPPPRWQATLRSAATPQAVVMLETGRARQAAALFDSMYRATPDDPKHPARAARERAWTLTLQATALAESQDTTQLAVLADSIESLGARSAYGRDRRLHHHIRGLLLRARGDLATAEAEFRSAIYSTSFGYTRTQLELARTLMARNHPADAVRVLQSALRGLYESTGYYVTRTQLQEELGAAFEAAGQRDSASVQYGKALAALAHADPELNARVTHLRARVTALRAAPPR